MQKMLWKWKIQFQLQIRCRSESLALKKTFLKVVKQLPRMMLLLAAALFLLPRSCALQQNSRTRTETITLPPAVAEAPEPPYFSSSSLASSLPPPSLSSSSLSASSSSSLLASLSAENTIYTKKAELWEQDLSQCRQELDQNKMDLYQNKMDLDQNKKELDQNKKKLDKNKRELSQHKMEFDLMVADLAKEQHLRQVAERHLLEYARGQKPTTTFQGSGGAVPAVETSLPISILENNIMRTDSNSSTLGSTYQRKGGDIVAITFIAGTSTSTQTGFFSGPMAPARQEEDSTSSSLLLEPPSRSIVIARRRLATSTVTTEAELTTALDHDARIELAADILLTSTVVIDGLTGVFIDGRGLEISGNDTVRCFYISNGVEAVLSNLTITRGFATGGGGGLYITSYQSATSVSMTWCTISKNTASGQYGGGGGLYIHSYHSATSVSMTWCTISKNTASGQYGGGGGLYITSSSATSVSMTSCTISKNTAPGQYGHGGGLLIASSATVKMISCTVSENAASKRGGGVHIQSSTLHSIGCTYSGNSASNGGGIYNLAGFPKFYSACSGDSSYTGTGTLDCFGCSGPAPADLSSTSSCVACTAFTPFACCGATACNALASTCSSTELDICPNPTPLPSTSHLPSLFPTSSPSLLTPLPTSSPSPAPTFVPTPLPTPLPTSSPSPKPTLIPTPLPTLLPTSKPSPAPTFVPTPLPTLLPTSSPSPAPTLIPTPLPTLLPTSSPSPAPTLYCGAGSFLNEASGACVLCAVGKFTDSSSAPFPTECQGCVVGTYANTQGMDHCESCQQGKFSSPDKSFCEDCSAGEYIKDAKACMVCEIGRYAPQPLTGACLACGAGSVTNNGSSATTCSPCNAGSFSTELTAVACTFCAVGRASVSGQKSCSPCEPGKYAGFQGSSTCTACAAGFAVATEGASQCNECTAGRSQSRASQLSCELCSGGKFSSESASTICSECTRGYSSIGGSSSCDGLTDEGYFLYQEVATECPKNSACNGGTLMPRPNAGYWVDRNSLDYVHVIYKCPTRSCVSHESKTTTNQRHLAGDDGGWSCWTMAAYSDGGSNDGSPCNSDNLLCKEGSHGVLCGSCDDGYIFSSAERLCTHCQKRAVVALFIAGIVVLFGGLFVASQYVQVVPSCVERSWVWGLLRQLDSGDLRVAWANYQIIQSSSWNLDLEYPSPFKEMLNALSIFSFDFLSLDCLFENSDHLLSVCVWSAVPIILAALIVLVHVAEGVFSWKVGNPCPKTATLTYRLLLLCYLVLPPVTFKQLQALDCVTVAGGSFLRIDTSIDCHSKKFQSFTTVNGFFLALYLATPFVWLFLLFRERKKLNPSMSAHGDDDSAHPQKVLDHILTARDGDLSLQPLRFLFGLYQPAYYYLECLEMYRRVLFVGVLPLLSAKTNRRSALGVFFSLCSLAFYGEVSPFLSQSTNVLASVAQYTNLLTFGAALAIEVGLDHGHNPFVFGCSLVSINLIVVGLIFRASMLKHFHERSIQQYRRALNSQELLIVRHVMRSGASGMEADLTQGSAFAEVELVEHGGENDKEGADIETRSMRVLKQSLIDSQHVKLTKRVGSGAFGEVFKGTVFRQPVAVKLMLKITVKSVRAFREEILLSATLRHPNIVGYVGSCWGEDLMCLLLEWIPRGTLSALIEDATLDLRWDDPLLKLAIDAARGMAYLHGREYFDERDEGYKKCILHRDLKPENALITDYLSLKITDFGISRAKAADDVMMTSLGTPLFCAPETSRGDPYDEKADVYSFGMVLMDMASDEFIPDFIGKRWQAAFSKESVPDFQAMSFLNVLRPIWEGKWAVVSKKEPIEYAPTSINDLIARCCSYDPKTRPSFTDILSELAGACSAEIESTAKVFFRHQVTAPPIEPWAESVTEESHVSSDEDSTTVLSISRESSDVSFKPLWFDETSSIPKDAVGVAAVHMKAEKKKSHSLRNDEVHVQENSPGSKNPATSIRGRCGAFTSSKIGPYSKVPPPRKQKSRPMGTAIV